MRSGDATTKKTNKKETTQNIEVFRTKRDESVTEEPVFVLPLTTKVKYRDVNTIIYIDWHVFSKLIWSEMEENSNPLTSASPSDRHFECTIRRWTQ